MSKPVSKPQEAVDTTAWFRWTMVFLLVEYARPQDLIPGVGLIRPAMLVMLILIFFLIKHRALLVRGSMQIRMIWYFIALLSLYIPFARNNYFAYATFTSMLKFMPFILSLLVCVNTIDRLKIFMKFYAGLMAYVALFALTHGGVGSGNYFADENDVSLYLNMVIPFCYFLFALEEKKTKMFFAATLLIGVLTVVVSFSRGGFVGLVLMFFIVWLTSPRKMVTVVVILVLGAGVYFYAGDKYVKEMGTVTDTKESTANARLKSWASGWDMFLDNPLGVGGNNFQVRFPEYQGDRFSRGMWGRVAHSLWFTLIPELGVVGIVIYFRLLFYNLRDIFSLKTRKKDKAELTDAERYLNAMSIAFLASLAGYFASASFISVLYYPHYWYLTAIIVACAQIRKKMAADEAPHGSVGGRKAPARWAPARKVTTMAPKSAPSHKSASYSGNNSPR